MILLFAYFQSIIITDNEDTVGVEINVGEGGMEIKIKDGETKVEERVRKKKEHEGRIETPEYVLVFRKNEGSSTVVKVLEPEGALVKIKDEKGRTIHSADIPTKFEKYLFSDGFYRFTVSKGEKSWSKKIELKRGYYYELYVNPQVLEGSEEVRAEIETKPEPEPKPKPMDEISFSKLINSMKKEAFEDTRLKILKLSAKKNYFTTSQLKRILEVFTFEDNKVKAFKIVYPRLVDKENVHDVLDSFKFSSTKDEIVEWIESGGEYDEDWDEGW